MITVGIDIGKGKHAIAVIDEAGKPISKPAFYDNNQEGANKLVAALATLASPSDTQVGMEATGNYWFAIHDHLAKAGYRIVVINPIVTSASISGDIRGRKSDKGDALVIARVLLMGDATPRPKPDTESRRLKALTRHRSFIVAQRSAMKKHLQSLLDVVFPEFHTLFEDMHSTFAMELLRNYPTATALSKGKRPAIVRIVEKHTRGKDAAAEAERLIQTAKGSLGVDSDVSDTFGLCIVSAVESIRDMDARIKAVEDEILSFKMPKLAEIISQISGSGKLLPRVIAAEFGDISRFEVDPKTGKETNMYKRMLAFAGSEPRIRESGKWKGLVRMSKRGSGSLRTAGQQIAFTISQNDPYFKAIYEKHINAKKPHKVALSFVFAALLQVVCSLWKSGRKYSVEKPSAEKVAA